MILLLSNKWDLSLDFIVLELRRRREQFLRINSEDLLHEQVAFRLPQLEVLISKAGRAARLSGEVSAVLNRRPGRPFEGAPPAERPSAATEKFLAQQWYVFLEALEMMPGVKWMNRFGANMQAENKLRQLKLADEVGFRVPPTLVSNDRNTVLAWMAEVGNVCVAKALYAPLIEEPEQDSFIFTQRIDAWSIDDDAALRLGPVIFQQALTPKLDLRVTVVGEQAFAVEIESDAGQALDWRQNKDAVRLTRTTLPKAIERRCVEYVHRSCLLFGAIDLVLHNGEYYFLEINPNGEWGWLQKPHGVPIAEAICDVLTAR